MILGQLDIHITTPDNEVEYINIEDIQSQVDIYMEEIVEKLQADLDERYPNINLKVE